MAFTSAHIHCWKWRFIKISRNRNASRLLRAALTHPTRQKPMGSVNIQSVVHVEVRETLELDVIRSRKHVP